MLLIVAFSAGLAATLTALGLAVVLATRFVRRAARPLGPGHRPARGVGGGHRRRGLRAHRSRAAARRRLSDPIGGGAAQGSGVPPSRGGTGPRSSVMTVTRLAPAAPSAHDRGRDRRDPSARAARLDHPEADPRGAVRARAADERGDAGGEDRARRPGLGLSQPRAPRGDRARAPRPPRPRPRHVRARHRSEAEFVTCEGCGAFEAVDPSRLDAARALIESELGYRRALHPLPDRRDLRRLRASAPAS